MLFNSFEFGIFLPIVFLLYWFAFGKNLQWQNLLLLFASYLFYGWWDWRFLGLILFSSVLDYSLGLRIGSTEDDRVKKLFLVISLVCNLGLLGFFKYYNFFVEQFITAFSFFGSKPSIHTLKIILPVGISFYTFQTLSYTIDVYRRKLQPTNDIVAFMAFVSFFPQLVAGPIERASNLLPQFVSPRRFDLEKAKDGLRQILWGLFKKVVIADNCAILVDQIFGNSEALSGSILLIGAILFAFQIYGDFSGYSDIAIGTGRLFGFNLMQNFAFPYFSRDIPEFWRRWHISLSTWFRDYVYIPLGGSRVNSKFKLIRNVLTIFLISGFWHGANWTFIFWGGLNALFFLPSILTGTNRTNLNSVAEGRIFPSIGELFKIISTFLLTCLMWIFFRAENLEHSFVYVAGILDSSLITFDGTLKYLKIIPLISILLIFEWSQRLKKHGLQINEFHPILRWTIYYTIIFLLLVAGNFNYNEFIYFQF